MTDQQFSQGIKTAVNVCMNVTADDKVFITTDQKTFRIGQALSNQVRSTGAPCLLAVLEDYGTRPLLEAPKELVDDLVGFKPTVTFFAAESQEGEIRFRMSFIRETNQKLAEQDHPVPRHAHMVSITPQLVREGLNADYQEINKVTMQVLELVKDAQKIHVTSEKGTDITATFNPDYNWVACHGLYHSPGERGNLPEGEVFTCPAGLDGILVVDLLGDYFSPKYGVLDQPLTIEIKDGWVTKISGENNQIVEELTKYLDSAENGRRAGEFAIGTNTALDKLSGNLLQDEKIPGIHVAFGNPYPLRTGADWTSQVHVDVIPTHCTIHVDGNKIMINGQFLI
jgi:leucyl aminopeptidase (aminopeptidase T)